MIRIILADDHQILREGLRRLLEDEEGLEIIADVGNGLEAITWVERAQPDVLIVDLMMPILNGLEVTRQVSQRFPEVRVIVLSMHATESYVLEALKNGAAGYVLKDASHIGLVQAIHEVMAGRRYLSPPLSERAIEAYIERAKQASSDPYDTLTPREREILQLLAEGFTNAEVAGRLSISPRTVETHRANLMTKLGLHNHTELVRFAIQRGILK